MSANLVTSADVRCLTNHNRNNRLLQFPQHHNNTDTKAGIIANVIIPFLNSIAAKLKGRHILLPPNTNRLSSPLPKNTRTKSLSRRYTYDNSPLKSQAPIIYFAVKYSPTARQLSTQFHESTLPTEHRQEWPTVYLPVSAYASTTLQEHAATIIAGINAQLCIIFPLLKQLRDKNPDTQLRHEFYQTILVQLFLQHWHNCWLSAPLSDDIMELPLEFHKHNSRKRINPKYNSRRHLELKNQIRLSAVDSDTRQRASNNTRLSYIDSDCESRRDNITRPLACPPPLPPSNPPLPNDPATNLTHPANHKFEYTPIVLWTTTLAGKNVQFDWSKIHREHLIHLPEFLVSHCLFSTEQLRIVVNDIQQYQTAKVKFGQRRDILLDDAMPYMQQALDTLTTYEG